METQKVDAFILANGQYFQEDELQPARDRLLAADESKWPALLGMQFKNPTTCLLLSLFFGGLGVDRFFVGDTGLGVLKLITFGGLGIWGLVDLFRIMGIARRRNMKKFRSVVG